VPAGARLGDQKEAWQNVEDSVVEKRVFSIEVERNWNSHVRIEVMECKGQWEERKTDKEV